MEVASYSLSGESERILDSTVVQEYAYVYNGSSLMQMVVQTTVDDGTPTTDTLYFSYDASGIPMSLIYNGADYYYTVNLQGDVTAILNTSGTAVVEYTYDAWGNILTVTGSMADTLGAVNPLTYRGYVYDTETGLYYLQSRYYNPETGRFINADALPSTGQGIIGTNMFVYCGNNPVSRTDTGGFFWDTVFDVISLCFSVAEVIEHPDDPMAWLGVAADVASLVVPCVSGGGALVRTATKADDVVDAVKAIDKADDVVDAVKAIDKVDDAVDTAKTGWHVGDDITNLTKAGNTPSWSTVRQRYWKNEAFYSPELYPNDLNRLKKGLAPIGDDFAPMELHHPLGRTGDNFFIFEPLTQTQHRWIHYGD